MWETRKMEITRRQNQFLQTCPLPKTENYQDDAHVQTRNHTFLKKDNITMHGLWRQSWNLHYTGLPWNWEKGTETTGTKTKSLSNIFTKKIDRENAGRACFRAKCFSIKRLEVKQTQKKTETHQAEVTMSMKMNKRTKLELTLVQQKGLWNMGGKVCVKGRKEG